MPYSRWTSRKFLVAVAGFLVFLLSEVFGLKFNIEAVVGIVGSVIAFVSGEAFVDAKRAQAQAQTETIAEVAFWKSEAERWYEKFRSLSVPSGPPGFRIVECTDEVDEANPSE